MTNPDEAMTLERIGFTGECTSGFHSYDVKGLRITVLHQLTFEYQASFRVKKREDGKFNIIDAPQGRHEEPYLVVDVDGILNLLKMNPNPGMVVELVPENPKLYYYYMWDRDKCIFFKMESDPSGDKEYLSLQEVLDKSKGAVSIALIPFGL